MKLGTYGYLYLINANVLKSFVCMLEMIDIKRGESFGHVSHRLISCKKGVLRFQHLHSLCHRYTVCSFILCCLEESSFSGVITI